jgi:murein DD-endopeptidase MepM/ murein hydrolase activator NlpD
LTGPQYKVFRVVAGSIFAQVGKLFGAGAVAVAILGSSPALANSSANADVTAPLRAAQSARQSGLGSGDEQFRKLFASWQSLDNSQNLAVASGILPTAATRVSIPSMIPVEGVRTSSGFGMREHPVLGGRRAHKGIDLAGPVGTPVYAPADGVVAKAEWFSSYGLYIQVEHGGELETRYGHLSRLNVAAGQFVHKGDLIGFIGTTGRSTGPHLHYEVRVAGVAVNPMPYMQEDAPGADGAPQLALAAHTRD